MAKVKIQGNASGTGVLTVTAPNTSTDRTITLPDATGTLLNSDGSGANLTNLPNGSQLDHSGTKKIEATATGVSVTGASYSTSNIGLNVNNFLGFSDNSFGRLVVNDTEICRVLSTGGITFNGDTAAANALDDYEEGTWTPGFGGATISAGHTTGYYTKIGRQVFLIWYSAELQISSASGGAEINGLPFTASSVTNANSLFSYQHGTAIDGGSTGGYIQRATTKMHFIDTNGTAKASYINGTRYIMIAGTYFTD